MQLYPLERGLPALCKVGKPLSQHGSSFDATERITDVGIEVIIRGIITIQISDKILLILGVICRDMHLKPEIKVVPGSLSWRVSIPTAALEPCGCKDMKMGIGGLY